MAVGERTREVVLDIEGMTCASCVTKVERALGSVAGVDMAAVNLATRIATVRTADGDVGDLVAAVTGVGYGARPHDGSRSPADEERAYRRRAAVAVPLTVGVLVATFLFPGEPWAMWAAWALATPVQFVAGWPFLRNAARSARHGATTMDTLIAIGSLAAYAVSVAAVLEAAFEVGGTGIAEHYFDTGAVIVTLILVGKTLEARARASAGDATRALLERGATRARIVDADGSERVVPVDELHPGLLVAVLPGEQIPADGVVREGISWVDLSMLTGESVPVDVGPGDEVVGAAINGHGRLVVFVTKVGAHTRLAEIVRLLEAAQGSKAPIQRLANRISAVFVPVVLVVAAATAVGWATVGGARPVTALLHAAAVLLIACPCALGLATPAAIMAGSGRAAELGVLFTGGEVYEAIQAADVVLLDKTGTVTRGAMVLTDLVPTAGGDADDVLALAAAAERGSEHPIARAVVDAALARGLDVPDATEHAIVPGAGASAVVRGDRVRVGRAEGLPADLTAAVDRWSSAGRTAFAVWREQAPLGVLAVADELRPDAADTVARLTSLGLEVAMITGDREATARAVAREVGIDRVLAGVSPGGKVDEVRRLQTEGRRVVLVGDGINDAPALAAAEVGVAMGGGTDVALAAADVRILGGSIGAVADAVTLARRTYRVIRQNLAWAFAYNVVMIPLAVAGVLDPILAAGAMAASSVTVVLNALRLRAFGKDRQAADVGRAAAVAA
jgi:heavy metal translocating P-type ATPase